ncbi:MAG: serine/threonine protein phosphatase [Rhizobiaceae bacterium]|nr:serine/threonine protein phosphatase [Rhizobiaceae bacterium]
MRLYAIGDVHGRLDLLEAMHARIAAEIAADRPADWRIIHLGDYIDRGPQSSGVIDRLIHVGRDDPRNLCLAGNHDVGLLDFLAEPQEAALFVRHGGVETALSYGVGLGTESVGELRRAHARLVEAIPAAHLEFLRGLTYALDFGDFFFCHAGIKPGVPLEQQSPQDLIWIRGEFHNAASLHPKVVVHGHTPVSTAELRPNRVNVDTGAYFSGRLTAFVVEGDEKRLIEVSEERR